MAFFCKNAQEESLREIAIQMRFANKFELLRELYKSGAITQKEYTEDLLKLYESGAIK